jgi:hypothetical protein
VGQFESRFETIRSRLMWSGKFSDPWVLPSDPNAIQSTYRPVGEMRLLSEPPLRASRKRLAA